MRKFVTPNFDKLYVANLGRDHLSVLDLKVKGQPLWHHRAQAGLKIPSSLAVDSSI